MVVPAGTCFSACLASALLGDVFVEVGGVLADVGLGLVEVRLELVLVADVLDVGRAVGENCIEVAHRLGSVVSGVSVADRSAHVTSCGLLQTEKGPVVVHGLALLLRPLARLGVRSFVLLLEVGHHLDQLHRVVRLGQAGGRQTTG